MFSNKLSKRASLLYLRQLLKRFSLLSSFVVFQIDSKRGGRDDAQDAKVEQKFGILFQKSRKQRTYFIQVKKN
jgi:hypothetical protein